MSNTSHGFGGFWSSIMRMRCCRMSKDESPRTPPPSRASRRKRFGLFSSCLVATVVGGVVWTTVGVVSTAVGVASTAVGVVSTAVGGVVSAAVGGVDLTAVGGVVSIAVGGCALPVVGEASGSLPERLRAMSSTVRFNELRPAEPMLRCLSGDGTYD
jgi:hypothetical protein